MLVKFADWIVVSLFSTHQTTRARLFTKFCVFVFPALSFLIIAYTSYQQTYHNLTNMVLERRGAIVHIAAIAIKEKLDHLTEIGVALASRVRFQDFIQEGKWQEAVAILQKVSGDFPYIDRVFITDPNGTEMAAMPEVIGSAGKNFSYRDWFKGVSQGWKPYVSEVYRRTAEPQYNVIAAAVPILTDNGAVIGILVLQVRLEILLNWSKEIDVGPSGFVYFVDHKGHFAPHPRFSLQNETIDFASLPAIKKGLQGQKGIEVIYNAIEKEERIVAFEPIPGYRWVAVAQQPAHTAFMTRNSTLRLLFIIYGFIFLANSFLTYFIYRIFSIIQRHRQQLQDSQNRLSAILRTARDAIISADGHGNIISWNKEAVLIFGYSESEVLGKPLTMLMPERFKAEHQKGMKRYLTGGEPHVIGKTVEMAAVKKDGSEFPVEISLSHWSLQGEDFFTGIIRDIAGRKQSEEKLREPETKRFV